MNVNVFVINMPNRPDRRKNIISLFNKIGCSHYTFVEPVHPKKYCRFLNEPQASLRSTTLSILESQKDVKGFTLIFEDDVILNPKLKDQPINFTSIIQSIIRHTPHYWDLIYLEYCFEFCSMTYKINSLLQRTFLPSCAASILFNNQSLPKICSLLTYYNCLPADNVYGYGNLLNRIVSYSLIEPLFIQDCSSYGSDLKHTVELNVRPQCICNIPISKNFKMGIGILLCFLMIFIYYCILKK